MLTCLILLAASSALLGGCSSDSHVAEPDLVDAYATEDYAGPEGEGDDANLDPEVSEEPTVSLNWETAITHHGTGGPFDPDGDSSLWDYAENPAYGTSSKRFVLSGNGSTRLRWTISDDGQGTPWGPYIMVFMFPVGDTPDAGQLALYPILETDYFHSGKMDIEWEKGIEIAQGEHYLGVLACNCRYRVEVLDMR
jgi:hypothetical protein